MNNQQEIHPELQPDFTPEIPESHHLPTWVWVTVVAIIGLLAIGLVTYGAYQYLNSNNQDDCITLYEPVCGKDGKTYSNSCVADLDGAEVDYMGKCGADEFEDWQTYRNETYEFEIKYPNDWSIDQSRSSSNEVVFDIGIPESRESIKVEENSRGLILEQVKSLSDESIITNESRLVVDGESAYKIETSEFGRTLIIFLHNNFIYTITTGGNRFIDEGILFRFID